jgi:hypothetical protein
MGTSYRPTAMVGKRDRVLDHATRTVTLGLWIAVVALVLDGCASAPLKARTSPPTIHPVSTLTPEAQAQKILDVVIPGDAVQVRSLPGWFFGGPAQTPTCSPLVDDHRIWTVKGDPGPTADFIRARLASWVASLSTGILSDYNNHTSAQILSRARQPSGRFNQRQLNQPGFPHLQSASP